MEVTHRVHGIPFHRIGECNRCIGEKSCCSHDCPFLEHRGGGEWCGIHGHDLRPQVCKDFPDHPWLHVIKDGKCSCQFIRLDADGHFSSEPLPFMD